LRKATYLATLIVANSSKKTLIGLLVSRHAQRVFLIVAVIASVMITVVLHSDAPVAMSEQTSLVARVVVRFVFYFWYLRFV